MRMVRMLKSQTEPSLFQLWRPGNNVQFAVVACGSTADSTTLALAAAAQQTGGRIVCILPDEQKLHTAQIATNIEFVVGDAKELLSNTYKGFDFVAIDCNLDSHETIITARHNSNAIVMGYNAFCKETWKNSDLRTQLLPISKGLLLTRTRKSKSCEG